MPSSSDPAAATLDGRLRVLLGQWDYQTSAAAVVALGAPALGRLLDAKEGKGGLWRPEDHSRDEEDALKMAIAAFGAHDLDSVLGEMRRRGWSDANVVLSGVGRVADPRVVTMLIALCASREPIDRLQAVGYLGEHRDARATAALVEALSDRSSDVRLAAIASLGAAGDPEAIEPLKAFAARATREWIAKEARDAAARIRKASGVPKSPARRTKTK